MIKRIALKAIEVAATASLMALIYFIAETPLRFAEYKLTQRMRLYTLQTQAG